MKKMFDSKFLFIVALSLIVLIILGSLAFYLFDDKDDVFTRNGYVINPLSGKVEKYFFDKDTPYKENLSSMIVFKDIDKKNASILKDSFLHYNDGSLSFLTNGAILDLDTINGSEAVNFYNITSSSIIEKTGDKYVIKTTGDDINLKNFVGRISENKYIIVGKLEAKIPGNEKNITGDYFEIVYSEKGIVNIENKDVKFQVTAEGTVIYANGIAIDLGAKKISKNGEDVMSLTSITINGDENIEIIPKPEEEKDDGNGGGEGTDNNANNQNEQGNATEEGGAGNGEGTGDGGTGKENTEINRTQDIVVSLKDAAIGSTSVDVTFDIYNVKNDDTFTLQVTNIESGRTVDVVSGVTANKALRVNLLSPNTKYLFTVTNDKDGNKYFQKIFETNDFGIKLEKTYATDSELGFKVTVDKDTDITNAKLSLYKYNEKTKQNEIVTTSYYDNVTKETKYSEKVTYLSSTKGNIEGVHEIIYDELDSNTIYTAVLDEFSLVSVNFKDVYNITETAMTLKKAPEFSNMTAVKNIAAGAFNLSLKDIVDVDNAIESYTYRIYEADNPNKLAIDQITKSNASPIEVKIGDKPNQLKNDINYFYKVIIEYFDNEKYVEYILDDTINFVMGSDPYVTVVPNESKISYDRIGATIYLTDNSCLISMPGREKCLGPSSARINVTTMTSTGIDYVRSEDITFEVNGDEIKYELELDELQIGTTYTISVEAIRNDDINGGLRPILNTDESRENITTKTLTNFLVKWTDKGSSANHVVNVDSRLIAKNGSGTLTPEETAAVIKKVELELYNGSYVEDFVTQEAIGTKTYVNGPDFNIKEHFYDHAFTITSDETFGLDIEKLRLKNGGQLSEYYTVVIKAYYDDNNVNEVVLESKATPYRISPLLLLEDITEPRIFITPIGKNVSGIDNDLVNPGTSVGYLVRALWDATGLSSNGLDTIGVNLYVYDDDGNRVSFYIKDGNNLVRVNEIKGASITSATDNYEKQIFMDYGTDYGVDDSVSDDPNFYPIMRRANSYYIGYQLIIDSSAGEILYPTNTNRNIPNDFGKYSNLASVDKENPTTTMYVAKSTANSITYRYTVKDPDHALYFYEGEDDKTYGYYYVVNDGSEVPLEIHRGDGNNYAGEFTINGLSKGDTYRLYYKKNNMKTGNFNTDVKEYFDDTDNGKRKFDGKYDFTSENYNLSYEVINPMEDGKVTDNKVTIKILANESALNRIVNYEVLFTDLSNNNTLLKNLWQLGACPGDTEQDIPRCFSVDYADIKSMKTHDIKVSVKAYYDTGITGFDYTIDSNAAESNNNYKYMIFQNNLVPGEEGKYIAFTSSTAAEAWDPSKNVGKGYYIYRDNKDSRKFEYTSILRNRMIPIDYVLTGSGYSTSYGILNPKMVSTKELDCNDRIFHFDSIVPKVSIDRSVRRIDGTILSLSLSGADIADFCAAGSPTSTCDNTGDVYLYIDVWNDASNVGKILDENDNDLRARPTVQSVKLNRDQPSAQVKAYIDKVKDSTRYYYNVYAYMNNNGHPVYTQLFDAGYETKYEPKTYNFTSLSSGYIYNSFSVRYKPNTEGEDYNDKLLVTTINLIGYTNNEQFNFDLGYAFCSNNDATCGIGENDTNLIKRIINEADVKTATVDTADISHLSSEDLQYGQDYYMSILAMYNEYYWDSATGRFKTRPVNLELNSKKRTSLAKLKTPGFTVERKAVYIPGVNDSEGEYAIDFAINVVDTDRVLDDGKYCVALKDATNNIVGNLQILNGDTYETPHETNGNCEGYNYDFSALDLNKQIRITGLTENTKYTIEVYSTAFINNYDVNVPIADRTKDIVKSHTVYSTNNSGVAFGNELQYSATAKSFVVTFLGGSNFDNVREVWYTIGLWDSGEGTTYNGSYVINNSKNFKPFPDTGYWYFEIDDPTIHNELGETYEINLRFKVDDGQQQDLVNYDFTGRAQYVEE